MLSMDAAHNARLDSEGDKDEWEEIDTYQGITDTAENYPTHEASAFRIEAVDDEADDDEPAIDDRGRQIIQAISRARGGEEYKHIAADLEYGEDWVGNVYRQWRDQDRHTELVPKADASDD